MEMTLLESLPIVLGFTVWRQQDKRNPPKQEYYWQCTSAQWEWMEIKQQ